MLSDIASYELLKIHGKFLCLETDEDINKNWNILDIYI